MSDGHVQACAVFNDMCSCATINLSTALVVNEHHRWTLHSKHNPTRQEDNGLCLSISPQPKQERDTIL